MSWLRGKSEFSLLNFAIPDVDHVKMRPNYGNMSTLHIYSTYMNMHLFEITILCLAVHFSLRKIPIDISSLKV
jgi:hypothetical protein